MKKGNLKNSNIVSVLSKMGHTDMITIGDAGLPIPNNVERIDISLIKNIPGFIETLDAVLSEMEVESIILAEEIKTHNTGVHNEILKRFDINKIAYCSHEEFKNVTGDSKAIIRTGECSPYANIILKSGVVFE